MEFENTFFSTEKPPSKPPASFSAPIYVPPKPAYLPPDMMPSVPGTHFLPTVRPEDALVNHLSPDLYAFPSHINSSYLPPELDSIKSSIDTSNPESTTIEESNEDTTFTPPKNLYKFPPNVEAAYLPPKTRQKSPGNSYLPIPSGNDPEDDSETDDIMSYNAPEDLNSFPPNIGSVYPKTKESESFGNSYLSPPSGDKDTSISSYNNSNYLPPGAGGSYLPALLAEGNVEGSQAAKFIPYSYTPPENPYKFPPNLQSVYLPPGMRQIKQSVNSYLPPASGSASGFYEGSKPTITDVPQLNMAPPADMMAIDEAQPANMMMDVPPDHNHSDHPPW